MLTWALLPLLAASAVLSFPTLDAGFDNETLAKVQADMLQIATHRLGFVAS